jgi:hypothetical protein
MGSKTSVARSSVSEVPAKCGELRRDVDCASKTPDYGRLVIYIDLGIPPGSAVRKRSLEPGGLIVELKSFQPFAGFAEREPKASTQALLRKDLLVSSWLW